MPDEGSTYPKTYANQTPALGCVFYGIAGAFSVVPWVSVVQAKPGEQLQNACACLAFTAVGACFAVGFRMSVLNPVVTLYEDHVEWLDWRKRKHSKNFEELSIAFWRAKDCYVVSYGYGENAFTIYPYTIHGGELLHELVERVPGAREKLQSQHAIP
ncbi:MAG TPA: hypothetical protein VG944_12885 [Fimbriimonas sp.]|nr:hypothetical protein [Fimbriimonas sp.]